MQIDNILKPIADNKRIKNIKYSNQFIQVEEQYSQLINEISANSISYYKSKLNNLELVFYDMLCKESKDVEVIYRLGIILIISYGASGFKTFTDILVGLYGNIWDEIEPKKDIADSDYTKLSMIVTLTTKLSRWVNEFIFFSNSEDFNIVHFLFFLKEGSVREEIKAVYSQDGEFFKSSVKYLRHSVENIKLLEEIVNKKCIESEEEEVVELHISFKGFLDSIEPLLLTMEEILSETSVFSIVNGATPSENFNGDEDNNGKSAEIIKHHSNLLIKTNTNKLLGLCILYCIENLDVDSMKLMSNIKSDNMLSEFIQHIVEKNKYDD